MSCKHHRLLASLLVFLIFNGCASIPSRMDPPLPVVPQVDLKRYEGLWYEIARYPHHFEEGCVAAHAIYKLREDGEIDVTNRCRMNGFEGPLNEANGTGWVVDTRTRARLKIRFFWPFAGDYWIVDLAPDYRYAVVSAPGRNYLWILSRTPQMSSQDYEEVLKKLRILHFDLSLLEVTPQSEGGVSDSGEVVK